MNPFIRILALVIAIFVAAPMFIVIPMSFQLCRVAYLPAAGLYAG